MKECKTEKLWAEKAIACYNRLMKSWLKNYDIEIYSTYNKGKSIVAERFIRTLKNKIYKYMTSVSKSDY